MQETMDKKYGNHLREMNLHTEYNRSEIRAKQESSRISLGLNTECLNQQMLKQKSRTDKGQQIKDQIENKFKITPEGHRKAEATESKIKS